MLANHDTAVLDVAQKMRFWGYTAYANHPMRALALNDGIHDLYPDVVRVRISDWNVEAIAEVETEDTVDFASAIQWETYLNLATRLGCGFYLVVPTGFGDAARGLLGVGRARAIYTYDSQMGLYTYRDVSWSGN